MQKYIAVHTYKGTPEATWTKLAEMAPAFALAMEQGQTPARCLTTWNPYPHGRADMAFCLWEANQPDDIITTLGPLNDLVATDLLVVDEIAWAEVAAAAKAKVKVPA